MSSTLDTGATPASSWGDLTTRSVALCRRDIDRWRRCADLSDRLEREGVEPVTAARLALEQFGA